MANVTQENAGRTTRLPQGKLGQRSSATRINFLRDVSNAEVSKQATRDQKLKQEEDSSYYVDHNTPDCDPDKDSIFTSKFTPSASFNNLVACLKNTKLSHHHYKAPKISSRQPEHNAIEEESSLNSDYGVLGPLKLPDVPDWEDLDLPDLDDP